MSKYTEKDIDTLYKIEWEGGVVDALEYGIKVEDFESDELKILWWQLEYHWQIIQKYVALIEQEMEYEDIRGI